MKKSKEELYRQEAVKSKNRFSTSFYYVDSTKAERLGLQEYKATVGDRFVRIISPNLEKFWGLEVFKHSNIGVNRATFLCLNKMFGERCPICEKMEEFRKEDPQDPRIGALRYQRRYLVFLYDVESSETQKKGLQWYDMPSTVKDNIMSLCEDKRTGRFVEIEHPDDGKDIEFRRVGTTKENTKYSGFKLVDNEPIPDKWMEDVPQFVDILRVPKYEDVEKELSGLVLEVTKEGEEIEEREASEPSGRRDYSRERREEVPEEIEDSSEEEEKSSSRGRRSRGKDSSKGSDKLSPRERAHKKAQELKDQYNSRKERQNGK